MWASIAKYVRSSLDGRYEADSNPSHAALTSMTDFRAVSSEKISGRAEGIFQTTKSLADLELGGGR